MKVCEDLGFFTSPQIWVTTGRPWHWSDCVVEPWREANFLFVSSWCRRYSFPIWISIYDNGTTQQKYWGRQTGLPSAEHWFGSIWLWVVWWTRNNIFIHLICNTWNQQAPLPTWVISLWIYSVLDKLGGTLPQIGHQNEAQSLSANSERLGKTSLGFMRHS